MYHFVKSILGIFLFLDGDKESNAAHIDNMIQRYKRLSLGSSDQDNVKKYEERLSYWEGRKDEESRRIYDDLIIYKKS